jgi:hypothetical protein
VRAAVLALYGGLYVDADTIMLKSPAALNTDCDFAYITWTKPPHRVVAAYVYASKGSKIAAEWLANINEKLAAGKTGWCELGEGALTPAIEKLKCGTELPRATFMPVDVDADVHEYFNQHELEEYITDTTIAAGLNHSFMTTRHASTMRADRQHINKSQLLIHKLFVRACEFVESHPITITVCTPTFRRPHLLGHLISAFEQQTYKYKKLIILDDTGELQPQSGRDWQIISQPDRYATLGAKRNAIAAMADTDALVSLDDDDFMLPDALKTIAAGLRKADWVRPSQVLVKHANIFRKLNTWARPDMQDKAYQGAWGFTKAVFDSVGGYPELSLGEDLQLALKLEAAQVCETDPVAEGALPYFVAAPYDNQHFSWECKDYVAWDKITAATTASAIKIKSPAFANNKLSTNVYPRGWSSDWYKEECR